MKKVCCFLPLCLLALLLTTSCVSTKKLTYFENHESIDAALSRQAFDARIMPKDMLQIQVFTLTPEASAPFNQPSAARSDYLVDNDGNIEYPVIGTVHLGGMTKGEAETAIKEKIAPYMSATENVVVHIRMSNYKFAILGGVNRPGVFTTPNEKVSILEAIAQAGDLTTFAYRDKIYLIREDSLGQKTFHQLDINDANIISSPYFYLQQNDVIYVEQKKIQARNAFISANTSIWFSLASSLMSIATFILALTR